MFRECFEPPGRFSKCRYRISCLNALIRECLLPGKAVGIATVSNWPAAAISPRRQNSAFDPYPSVSNGNFQDGQRRSSQHRSRTDWDTGLELSEVCERALFGMLFDVRRDRSGPISGQAAPVCVI